MADYSKKRQKVVVGQLQTIGQTQTINSQTITVLERDSAGLITKATGTAAASTQDGQAVYAKSAEYIKTNVATGTAAIYENIGDTSSSSFNLISGISAGEITLARGNLLVGNSSGVAAALDANNSGQILVGDGTDLVSVAVSGDVTLASNGSITIQNNTITAGKTQNGAITPAKLAASEALTATADGLTTGVMSGDTLHAVVTSAAATDAITLPPSSSTLIGKTFTIWVGANGFELLTPANSNATINGTDSDGTNQADIPANSLSRLTLVTANTWILENIGSTGTVAAAIVPDND